MVLVCRQEGKEMCLVGGVGLKMTVVGSLAVLRQFSLVPAEVGKETWSACSLKPEERERLFLQLGGGPRGGFI